MHTTAIIIVRWRKKGETRTYIRVEGRGRRALFGEGGGEEEMGRGGLGLRRNFSFGNGIQSRVSIRSFQVGGDLQLKRKRERAIV